MKREHLVGEVFRAVAVVSQLLTDWVVVMFFCWGVWIQKRTPPRSNCESRSIISAKLSEGQVFRSSESPLRASLDELVHQQAQVGQDEATNVESEELGRVADAEFKADVRLRRMLEARVFDLTGDLIYVKERIG
jgi:hypothetical protein